MSDQLVTVIQNYLVVREPASTEPSLDLQGGRRQKAPFAGPSRGSWSKGWD
jgi:hypothetical protein